MGRFAAALLLAQARAAARHYSVYDGPMPPVYGESEANAAFMRRWVTENAKVPKRESDGNPWGDDEPACDLVAKVPEDSVWELVWAPEE